MAAAQYVNVYWLRGIHCVRQTGIINAKWLNKECRHAFMNVDLQ